MVLNSAKTAIISEFGKKWDIYVILYNKNRCIFADVNRINENETDINTEDFMAAVDIPSMQDNVDAERIGIIGICC